MLNGIYPTAQGGAANFCMQKFLTGLEGLVYFILKYCGVPGPPSRKVFAYVSLSFRPCLQLFWRVKTYYACCRKSGTFALARLLQNKVEQIFF